MLMLAYSLALTLGLAISAPWWLLRMATTQRYREGFWQRLGRVPTALREITRGKRVLWIHAVSVGEVLAASRLVTELDEALGNQWQVVLSTTTRTGQTLAQQRFGAPRVFYFPLDFAFAVRAYLRALHPAALILMESELWPRTLHECQRAGIPVAVVNARVSDRSFARAQRFKSLWSRIASKPTLWLAQSDEDARRLIANGARAETVHAIGNLKYDIRAPKQSHIAELIKEAADGRAILVGGSTIGVDPPEDSPLIRARGSMSPNEKPLLVLAPRHPEEFDIIYSMAMEYPTLRATELLKGAKATDAYSVRLREKERARVEIIILDTIGDLAAVYGAADLAFVGGSLLKRGGHNPLEPAQFGVPVIMGPSYENFRGIVELMTSVGAISIVGSKDQLLKSDVSSELSFALMEEIHRLLRNPEAARAMGQRGRAVFEAQQGATTRAVEAILKLVQP